MPDNEKKLTPAQLLHRAQKQDEYRRRGRHKIFVGFAAGVGKTYTMLQEAQRRKSREHQDIVIGFVETHGREQTAHQIGDLEIVPRRRMEYRGVIQEEMDLDAVLVRRPEWCLIDELAHTNVPGSKHRKRWEDADEVLNAGINVLSTLNIQHLDSLNDKIFEVTGVRVRETIPDGVVLEADEVVNVDVTPEALLNRIRRGEVYTADKIDLALANFFRDDNLIALREMCLSEVAERVEKDFEESRQARAGAVPFIQERVAVCVLPGPRAVRVLRRGYRLAQRAGASVCAVYVHSETDRLPTGPEFDELARASRELGVELIVLRGDVREELVRFVRSSGITILVLGHIPPSGLSRMFQKSLLDYLLQCLPEIDITVIGGPLY